MAKELNRKEKSRLAAMVRSEILQYQCAIEQYKRAGEMEGHEELTVSRDWEVNECLKNIGQLKDILEKLTITK